MADWATIGDVGTAAGTLVLAAATFASVRAGKRANRVTERALLAQICPLLVPARPSDPGGRVSYVDDHWVEVQGRHASIDVTPDAIYLTFSVRNVGAGIAVLDRWDLVDDPLRVRDHRGPSDFTRVTLDIYVPPGDVAIWQGALRDPSDDVFVRVRSIVEQGRRFAVDLLYADHEGGQRMISRFSITPTDDGKWVSAVARHWNLDRADPR